MKYLLVIVLILVTNNLTNSQKTITPGVDIIWSLKESERAPQKICFTCPGLVSMGVISTGYCGNCFGVWIPSGGTNYCLHYKGPSQLNYDKVKGYKIPVACDNGATTDTTNVALKIIPNSPPYFTKSTSISIVNGAVNTLVTLEAGDFDTTDDLVWTILPSTYQSKFYTDGTASRTNANLIRKTDLSEVCENEIVLHLIVSDSFNPPVGTTTVTIQLDNNTPQVTSLNKQIQWPENKQFYSYFQGPSIVGAGGTCIITSDPVISNINNGGCSTTIRRNPYFMQGFAAGNDFETTPPINFTLVYQKGKCPSNPVWLHVTWTDINEKPELTLAVNTYTISEGAIKFQPEYGAVDPDANDKVTFKLVDPNNQTPFEIDPNTGRIYTNRYFSTGGAASVTRELNVYLTDKAGLQSDIQKITITIQDINDNAPVLDSFVTTYYFLDCQEPGPIVAITVQDADPGINGETEFVVATSSTMQLTADGKLSLIKAPFDKEFDTINIEAVDKGTPVLHSEIRQVSVIGQPCPTTPAPYVPTPTTQPPPVTTPAITTTVTPEVTTMAIEDSLLDDPVNIVLIALASLVAFIVMVGATCFLIRCSRLCCTKTSPRTNMVRPGPQKPPKPYDMSNDAAKTKPDADAESGVYSEGEEEIFEEEEPKRNSLNSNNLNVNNTNQSSGNLSARSLPLDF